MILIDTNIFIDHLRQYEPATRFLNSVRNRDDVIFSAITEAELVSGSANDDPARRQELIHLLRQWTKISMGNPVAAFAGDIRREHGLAIPDAIIAATARAHNATLITRNVKDFAKVPDLRLSAPYS